MGPESGRAWQGRRDSNPQRTGLESAVLPLNYAPRASLQGPCLRSQSRDRGPRARGFPPASSWWCALRRRPYPECLEEDLARGWRPERCQEDSVVKVQVRDLELGFGSCALGLRGRALCSTLVGVPLEQGPRLHGITKDAELALDALVGCRFGRGMHGGGTYFVGVDSVNSNGGSDGIRTRDLLVMSQASWPTALHCSEEHSRSGEGAVNSIEEIVRAPVKSSTFLRAQPR